MKQAVPHDGLGLGRVQDAGTRAARAPRACGARAIRRDEYFGTLVNAYLALGGRADGVNAGESYVDVGTFNGYREANILLEQRRLLSAPDLAPIPAKLVRR